LNKYLYNGKSEIKVNVNNSSKKLRLSVSQLQQNMLRGFMFPFPQNKQLFADAVRSTKQETETKDLAFVDYRNVLHSAPLLITAMSYIQLLY
jgi:hypothetical protein